MLDEDAQDSHLTQYNYYPQRSEDGNVDQATTWGTYSLGVVNFQSPLHNDAHKGSRPHNALQYMDNSGVLWHAHEDLCHQSWACELQLDPPECAWEKGRN